MSTPMSTEQTIDRREQLKSLLSVCRRLHKRTAHKLQKQREELAEAKDYQRLRQLGDTLLANADRVARGTHSCTLTNAHTGEPAEIRLNPKLDARRNAELFYRKARRAQGGLETIEANAARSERQLHETATMLTALRRALETDSDTDHDFGALLGDTTERLQALGAIPRTRQTARDAHTEVPYRHVRFAGYHIYIGRNDTQNDELTVHFARPWDLWLHVAVHAGSHVVLRRERHGPPPPERVIGAAAALAAWFSKARHSSSVEVHVAEKRYVQKRRRSPAGEVYLQQYKSLRVNPLSPQQLLKRYPDAGDRNDA